MVKNLIKNSLRYDNLKIYAKILKCVRRKSPTDKGDFLKSGT